MAITSRGMLGRVKAAWFYMLRGEIPEPARPSAGCGSREPPPESERCEKRATGWQCLNRHLYTVIVNGESKLVCGTHKLTYERIA